MLFFITEQLLMQTNRHCSCTISDSLAHVGVMLVDGMLHFPVQYDTTHRFQLNLISLVTALADTQSGVLRPVVLELVRVVKPIVRPTPLRWMYTGDAMSEWNDREEKVIGGVGKPIRALLFV